MSKRAGRVLADHRAAVHGSQAAHSIHSSVAAWQFVHANARRADGGHSSCSAAPRAGRRASLPRTARIRSRGRAPAAASPLRATEPADAGSYLAGAAPPDPIGVRLPGGRTPAMRSLRSLIARPSEDEGGAGRQHAAGSVAQRDLDVRDLARGASPRNCRTASTMRNIPRMPGWQADSPPPSVLVGNGPSHRSRPSSTNGPPSPFLQKPRSSSDSNTVIVNES